MEIPRVNTANTLYEIVRKTAVYDKSLDLGATPIIKTSTCNEDR